MSAGLKAIRKRISSVKSTQKITRAMKLVAAARLRRAQQRIVELRPYALKTLELLSEVAARAEDGEAFHPLLARREPKRVMLVVLTSDRGLAGAFNASVNRAALRFWRKLETQGIEVAFAFVGRKGRDYLKRRSAKVRRDFTGVWDQLDHTKAAEIARYIISEYVSDPNDPHSVPNLDAVYLVYNQFKSAIAQSVVCEPLLPITTMELPDASNAGDYVYEPDKRSVLNQLLPMYVEVEVYRALLESMASEHGARMTAMEAATRNAAELIRKLTLQFNRARQAAITKELMEIIGGAEALNG